jgi:pyruvate-ferredoxin/flavodoxin oxidoreductase
MNGGADSVAQDHSGHHRTIAPKARDDDGNVDIKKKVYKTETECVDGNWAVAHVAYRTNDCAYIFPITPSSPMGEEVDAWAAKHKKNLWGQDLKVLEMQSEGGAGTYLVYNLYVTQFNVSVLNFYMFTVLFISWSAPRARFGLSPRPLRFRKAYIPNLYKIAGELLPTVIHVARGLAGEALSSMETIVTQ